MSSSSKKPKLSEDRKPVDDSTAKRWLRDIPELSGQYLEWDGKIFRCQICPTNYKGSRLNVTRQHGSTTLKHHVKCNEHIEAMKKDNKQAQIGMKEADAFHPKSLSSPAGVYFSRRPYCIHRTGLKSNSMYKRK